MTTSLPNDVAVSSWDPENLALWQEVIREGPSSCAKTPLEGKAWHAIGLLVKAFDAAGHALHFTSNGDFGPKANNYIQAYLIACSAIELLARCKEGDPDFLDRPNVALEKGLKLTGLMTQRGSTGEYHLSTNEVDYDLAELVALRNLAAHGMGVASVRGQSRPDVFLHIKLLDHFPERLAHAFDDYYRDLLDPLKREVRVRLARSGLEPVLYSDKPGQAFPSPIVYAYENIAKPQKKPSEVLRYKDWQVYKADEGRAASTLGCE